MALTRLVVCTSDDQVLFTGVSERARPLAPSAVVPVIDDEAPTAEVISGVYRVDRGADGLGTARVPVFDEEDEDTGEYHVGGVR
jgi:hypothetical protein